mmetsp:Transcript_104290/g.311457  ORF Transcript_104290/g.311457 Transcript_104290/m.311457 type:complete len:218 (-) Transcript_104290:114-767(-)
MWPLWITPKDAVALNFAQFVALANHSRFFRRKTSLVVPHCIRLWQITVPLCKIEFLESMEFLMISRSRRSDRLLRKRNSRCRSMDVLPERIFRSCSRFSFSWSLISASAPADASVSTGAATGSAGCAGVAPGAVASPAAAPAPASTCMSAASGAGAAAGGSFSLSCGDPRSVLQNRWFSLSTMSKPIWKASRRPSLSPRPKRSFSSCATCPVSLRMK